MARDYIPPFVHSVLPPRVCRARRGWRRVRAMVRTMLRVVGLKFHWFFAKCPATGFNHRWSDWLGDEEGSLRWCEECGRIQKF